MSDAITAVPPQVEMIRMGSGYWLSSLVYTAAKISLADHLANGPKSAADLAGVTGANPRALHRFMRTLASFGILTLNDDDTFTLTELGATLKKDAPGAVRSTVITLGSPVFWQAFGDFDLKTSSWVLTPHEVRALGGALFCDRRYGRVFVYHNGASSYYAARGFRGFILV